MNPGLSLALVGGLQALFWGYAWVGLRARRTPAPAPSANTPLTTRGIAAGEPARSLAAVEGLRGMLALGVFIHHAACTRSLYVDGTWDDGEKGVLSQLGPVAVTLFFFITGFLFWEKLRRDRHLDFWPHMRSRFKRLAPAYLAMVGVVVIVVGMRTGWTVRVPLPTLLRSVLDWLLFTLPGPSDINGLANTKMIVAGVPWTLRLEWIFYAVVPFLAWFAARPWRTFFMLALILGAHALALALAALPALSPHWAGSLTAATRLHARTFGGGIFVAAAVPWVRARLPAVNFRAAGFSAPGLVVMIAVLLLPPDSSRSRQTALLLVPFALIVLGSDGFGALTSGPARFLGRISYSIYLLHGVVLHTAFLALNQVYPVAALSRQSYWLLVAMLGAGVITLAAHWYRWFEAPFISRKTT